MKKQDYWFVRKRYGWGWIPGNWKGWLILAIWTFIFVMILINADKNFHSVSDVMYRVVAPEVLTGLFLVVIAALTGEPPRWQWSGK